MSFDDDIEEDRRRIPAFRHSLLLVGAAVEEEEAGAASTRCISNKMRSARKSSTVYVKGVGWSSLA